MPIRHRALNTFLLTAIFVASTTLVACAPHSVPDPYYNDTHRWDHHEEVLYEQWEVETHRDHVDFQLRAEPDQHAYFDWRHNHHG